MKTYLFDSIERYKRFSESLDVKAVICNKSWNIFNDSGEKEIYIFQEDGSLIISNNGKVTDGSWKYIPANKSIIINGNDQSYMLHPAFMDEVIFALQVDGTQLYTFLIDESNKQAFEPKTYSELLQYFKDKELAKTHIAEEQKNYEQFLITTDNPLEHVNKDQIVWQTFKEARIKVGEKFIDVETGNYYLEEYLEYPQIKKQLKEKNYFVWRNLRIICCWIAFLGIGLFSILGILTIMHEILLYWDIDFPNWGKEPFTEISLIGKILFIFCAALVFLGIPCWIIKDLYLKEKQRKAFIFAIDEMELDIPEITIEEYVNRGFKD